MITMNSAPCILIEGLDLAGKTSACRALVAGLSPRPEHRCNALTSGNVIYDVADQVRRAGGLHGTYLGYLYLAAMAMDLRLYSPPVRMTIQESTIGLRSFCHYQARGERRIARAFAALLDADEHPRFDRSIVLTASLEARRNRLEMRRREAPEEIADDDLAVLVAPDTFRRMDDILITEATRRFGAAVIDTSDMSMAEVVTAVGSVIAEVIGAMGMARTKPIPAK
jgi:hypothetical protein